MWGELEKFGELKTGSSISKGIFLSWNPNTGIGKMKASSHHGDQLDKQH